VQGGSDGLSGKPEDTSSFSDETLGWLNLHFEPNLHLWVFRKYCKVWDSNELENDQIHTKREKKKIANSTHWTIWFPWSLWRSFTCNNIWNLNQVWIMCIINKLVQTKFSW